MYKLSSFRSPKYRMGSGKDKSRSFSEKSHACTGGVEAQLLSFLTSALDRSGLSTSRPGRFKSGK